MCGGNGDQRLEASPDDPQPELATGGQGDETEREVLEKPEELRIARRLERQGVGARGHPEHEVACDPRKAEADRQLARKHPADHQTPEGEQRGSGRIVHRHAAHPARSPAEGCQHQEQGPFHGDSTSGVAAANRRRIHQRPTRLLRMIAATTASRTPVVAGKKLTRATSKPMASSP